MDTPVAALMSGLAAGDTTMQVSYSPFRGFDPAPIAAALTRYPYGCTEQLVSAAYPVLYGTEVSADPKARRMSAGLVSCSYQSGNWGLSQTNPIQSMIC